MSKTLIQPYLFFGGRCEEAVRFYQSAIGAEVEMMMRIKESPEPPPPEMVPPGWEEKIMHASMKIGESVVMAADGCDTASNFHGFSLSLSLPDEDAAHQAFAALSQGGEVKMPLAKTFWSPCFGVLTDRFGLGWMITVLPQAGAP